LLMQRRISQDLSFGNGEQGQIAAKVDILTPVSNDFRFRHPMFDEHPFLRRQGEEKFVERRFIRRLQRPHIARKPPFHSNRFRILVQYIFQSHSRQDQDRSQTEPPSMLPRADTEASNPPRRQEEFADKRGPFCLCWGARFDIRWIDPFYENFERFCFYRGGTVGNWQRGQSTSSNRHHLPGPSTG